MTKRGIALLDRTGVSNPEVSEPRFHVEHCPVHPPPAPKATLLDELVDSGVDDLNWESLRQLRQRPRRRATDAGNGSTGPGDLDAHGLPGNSIGAAEHREPRLTVTDEALRVSGPKRPASTQQENGL